MTVSDQGKGVDPRILDSETAPPGLGLLSLSARHIGGSLSIDSASSQGGRFTPTVPCSTAKQPPAIPPEPVRPSSAPPAAAIADGGMFG